MTRPRSTRFASARAALGERRPRQLHLHDQRRQGARARRRAGAPAAARDCAALSAAPSRRAMRTDQPAHPPDPVRPRRPDGPRHRRGGRRRPRLRDRPRPWRRAGRFFRPGRARRRASTARSRRASRSSSAPPGSTTSPSAASPRPRAHVAVLRAANTSLGVALARRPGRARGARARPRLGYRDRRGAPSPQGRRAVGHRASRSAKRRARGRGGEPPRGARPRRHRPQAREPARSAMPRCAAARSPATMT